MGAAGGAACVSFRRRQAASKQASSTPLLSIPALCAPAIMRPLSATPSSTSEWPSMKTALYCRCLVRRRPSARRLVVRARPVGLRWMHRPVLEENEKQCECQPVCSRQQVLARSRRVQSTGQPTNWPTKLTGRRAVARQHLKVPHRGVALQADLVRAQRLERVHGQLRGEGWTARGAQGEPVRSGKQAASTASAPPSGLSDQRHSGGPKAHTRTSSGG